MFLKVGTGCLALATLAVTVSMSACDRGEPPQAGASTMAGSRGEKRTYPINVVCTVGMVADIVRNIGGEHVQVRALMGEGVDPHMYQASPGDVRLLSGADVIVYNGLNLEGRITDVLVKLARKIPTIAASEGVPEDLLREPPKFKGHYDPHVWFDVSLWMHSVQHTRDVFVELDPDHADDYVRNSAAYVKELEALHDYAKRRIATIDKNRRTLVTAHDAFGYFGRAYDIDVRAIQGLSTESEASVKDINELVAFIAKRKVKAVFVESSVSEKNIRALVEGCAAAGHSITIGGELFSDAMGREGSAEGTYIGMVRHNVDTIVKALK